MTDESWEERIVRDHERAARADQNIRICEAFLALPTEMSDEIEVGTVIRIIRETPTDPTGGSDEHE